jgi:hypothetical protein
MEAGKTQLIDALRKTADRLDLGARYEWGHMGRCNCGHLVQTVMNLSDRQIVAAADMQLDEWTEHAREFCSGNGTPVDALFAQLAQLGFTVQDVMHLEYLSDRNVLTRMAPDRPLRHNDPADVGRYMRTMADLLESPTSA